ncbi:MAG TPA: TolC family protein [Bryobacteraceae bacterium]|nr:TolC family protein [Bryobacteraceae bacterium]
MRTRLARALTAAAMLFTGARAAELTEKEAVRRFLAESSYSRESAAGVAAVEAETRGWSLLPNPAAAYSREGAGLTEILQYEQPLPVSGRLGLLRQAGTAAVAAARSQAGRTRWELINDLRSAFYRLLAAQEREAAVSAAINDLDEVVRILRRREQEGEGSSYDRLRAERERSEMETETGAARILAAQARSQLAAFFAPQTEPAGVAVQGRIEAEIPLPAAADLYARAFAARSDIDAARRQSASLDLRRRAAERLRIPEPSIAAGIKRGEVGDRTPLGSYVAVSVPLPLFNRGGTEAARLRAEGERSEARRGILEQRIRAEVAAAHATLELRRRALTEYRSGLQAQGRQLEQIARAAYQEGELGILELLDAYRVSLQSRLRSLDLASAARQAEIELERAVGEPVLNPEVLP